MERVFQPTREELLDNKFSMKGAWKNKFNNNNPIVVELGCGKGEYSVALGKMNTEVNYIGIGIKGARIDSGAEIAEKENLTNVYFSRLAHSSKTRAIDRAENAFFGATAPKMTGQIMIMCMIPQNWPPAARNLPNPL